MSTAPIFAASKRHQCQACRGCEFSIYYSHPHVGARCAACGHFLKWLSQGEKRSLRLPPMQVMPTQPAVREKQAQTDLFGVEGGEA